ncbi:hypothetical protein CANCADRAFT_3740, partial [Tortispora caseinolytica NRRL Y-17796]
MSQIFSPHPVVRLPYSSRLIEQYSDVHSIASAECHHTVLPDQDAICLGISQSAISKYDATNTGRLLFSFPLPPTTTVSAVLAIGSIIYAAISDRHQKYLIVIEDDKELVRKAVDFEVFDLLNVSGNPLVVSSSGF